MSVGVLLLIKHRRAAPAHAKDGASTAALCFQDARYSKIRRPAALQRSKSYPALRPSPPRDVYYMPAACVAEPQERRL